ncbi:MAG: tetratricopeptide repeat protein [Planctomycetota bacterium]
MRCHPLWAAALALGAMLHASARVHAGEEAADFPARFDAAVAANEDAPLRALVDEVASGAIGGEDAARVEAAWAARLEARGEDAAALDARGWLVRERGDPADRIALAENLLRQAQRRISAGVTRGLGVTTLLADALDALAPLWAQHVDGEGLDGELRARALFTEGWARTLRGDAEGAAQRLGRVDRGSLPERWRQPVADALARARHAAGDARGAAEAFLEAGNVHGAAASYAAARDAMQTARLYGQLLAASPDDAALQAEALRAARFAEAAAPLADALAPLVHAGTAPASLEATRAEALGMAGRNEEAIEAWRALKRRDAQVAGADAALATRLAARGKPGDLDEAVELAVAELGRDPESTAAGDLLWAIAGADYENLHRDAPDGRLLARCLRAQEALVAAREDDPTAWANLGNTLRVGGQASEAVAAYDRAVELDPYDPDIRSDRGLARSAAGDEVGALAAFQEALELDAGHLSAHQNAARRHLEAGRPREALGHLEAALASARARGERTSPYRLLMGRAWRALRDATPR